MNVLGTLLGNYRIVELLGEGGMGVVYRGRHESLGQAVAVKVLRPDLSSNANMVQRFFNEAQTTTAIRNQGIIRVYDFGRTSEGQAYFVMELLEGKTLKERLEERNLTTVECCRIARQIANVLQDTHAAGIVHRDLKPDNLFLIRDAEVSGGERIKVLDFGIAKLISDLQNSTNGPSTKIKTNTGAILGTPYYMSPEQCRGSRDIDYRTDIYSLGCILFEMMYGAPPFPGEGVGEIVGAHLHVEPKVPETGSTETPVELAILIKSMLAKSVDARPQTMAEVSQALEEFLRIYDIGPERLTPIPRQVANLSSTPGPATSSTTLNKAGPSSAKKAFRSNRFWMMPLFIMIISATIALLLLIPQRRSQSESVSVSVNPQAHLTVTPIEALVDAASNDDSQILGDAAIVELSQSVIQEINSECRRYQISKEWRKLAQCAERLAPFSQNQAESYKFRAIREINVNLHVEAVELALQKRDLRSAKAELDLIWGDSADYPRIRQKYDQLEKQFIDDLAKKLAQAIDRNCLRYAEMLGAERAALPPRVSAEAAKRVPCTPATACNAEELADTARQQLETNKLLEALNSFEAAYACDPLPRWAEQALVVACTAGHLLKAKIHWRQLPVDIRNRSIEICEANRITENMLNAP